MEGHIPRTFSQEEAKFFEVDEDLYWETKLFSNPFRRDHLIDHRRWHITVWSILVILILLFITLPVVLVTKHDATRTKAATVAEPRSTTSSTAYGIIYPSSVMPSPETKAANTVASYTNVGALMSLSSTNTPTPTSMPTPTSTSTATAPATATPIPTPSSLPPEMVVIVTIVTSTSSDMSTSVESTAYSSEVAPTMMYAPSTVTIESAPNSLPSTLVSSTTTGPSTVHLPTTYRPSTLTASTSARPTPTPIAKPAAANGVAAPVVAAPVVAAPVVAAPVGAAPAVAATPLVSHPAKHKDHPPMSQLLRTIQKLVLKPLRITGHKRK